MKTTAGGVTLPHDRKLSEVRGNPAHGNKGQIAICMCYSTPLYAENLSPKNFERLI